MDMKEMVAKVKAGEPLYGHSILTEYQQHVAARNSRYSALMMHVIPWFNFVNHNAHGVDTAKYYRQAEKELEEERLAGQGLGNDGKARLASSTDDLRRESSTSVVGEVEKLGRSAWDDVRNGTKA